MVQILVVPWGIVLCFHVLNAVRIRTWAQISDSVDQPPMHLDQRFSYISPPLTAHYPLLWVLLAQVLFLGIRSRRGLLVSWVFRIAFSTTCLSDLGFSAKPHIRTRNARDVVSAETGNFCVSLSVLEFQQEMSFCVRSKLRFLSANWKLSL